MMSYSGPVRDQVQEGAGACAMFARKDCLLQLGYIGLY